MVVPNIGPFYVQIPILRQIGPPVSLLWAWAGMYDNNNNKLKKIFGK